MKPANLLFILPDQYNRDALGCYGNPVIKTPNLDRIAEQGVCFSNAYTNCPICIPARASLATGRYAHEIGSWDNAFPYDGSIRSWHHRVRNDGYVIDAIGKLHFRSDEDDNGFSQEIETMHVVKGMGDVLGCLRHDTNNFNKRKGALEAGPGDSSYLQYDARNGDNACSWLRAHKNDDQPWALFLGFVLPHPPTVAPPDLFNYYSRQDLPMPPQWEGETWPRHPAMDFLRRFFQFQEPLGEEAIRRFVAAYYGICTFVDQQVGRVLATLDEIGLTQSTRIIFLSDHGEAQGARGVFGKFNMYEESAAVPLLMSGPDIPQGVVVDTPVSLVDCYPTVLEAFDIEPDAKEAEFPGSSLWSLLETPGADRTVFSEYHAVGSHDAIFMLRNLKHKYVYHVGKPPQLFNLQSDPEELNDLAGDPLYEGILGDFEEELRRIVDPETIDQKAKADQKARIDTAGGEKKVREMGTFDNTPIPGEDAEFFREASELQ